MNNNEQSYNPKGGRRTPEGKAICSQNALDHGLAKFHWLKERVICLQEQAFFTEKPRIPATCPS